MDRQYQPLSYELFCKLPESIQTEMINEVISGIEFVRGGTFYTPELFRKDLEQDKNHKFHFSYKISSFSINKTVVVFIFGKYYNDTYFPHQLQNWEGFSCYNG